MLKRLVLFCIAACVAGVMILAAQPRYNIGRGARTEDIRARDISIAPDGRGLLPGHGTAVEGRLLYRDKCASCHGNRGRGKAYFPALVGGQGTLTSDTPTPTVGSYWPYATTVWDYIHRTMPYQTPGTLTPKQVYSLTAYILFMNKIIGEHDEMNRQTLPKVKMPNRSGFIPDPRPDVTYKR